MEQPQQPSYDWLLNGTEAKARLCRTDDPSELVLANGLISRTFRLSPNCATIGFRNLMTGQALLRAVEPEGLLEIDGKAIPIGGLTGQPDRAYLDQAWIPGLRPKNVMNCLIRSRAASGAIP